ncbi:YidH family protein [Bifidobacterium simiarum]|uniref:YidH family protein n=1 Tax=Bifidobacterium simiarum TaxID=2045441 RepID=UPI001BDD5ECF|nr:DUF202 domain-containing protein [Bifidobacterium simiarum]MBT1166020.1 DUF202 domain-containing protein [Bifidobacterium simiarum]
MNGGDEVNQNAAEQDEDGIGGWRRPRWIFGEGSEPDPRFSLANERTYLSWIRTSMAFIAAGAALHAVTLQIPIGIKTAMSLLLLSVGVLIPPCAWVKRARTERAMRKGAPLPVSLPAEYLVGGVLLAVGVLLGVGIMMG